MMKLRVLLIVLVNMFIIFMIIVFFKKNKTIKEKDKSIITETKIDTFFQENNKKPMIKNVVKKYLTRKDLPDVVIKKQMAAIHSPIKFEYNDIVDKYIKFYAFDEKKQTAKYMGLSTYYFPLIESILHKEKMPTELKYLPIIESSLRTNAVSPAGATGLWQLMYNTAEIYDLHITSYIDERRDPVLSTKAAATYLKDLHKQYNNWLLTIAAYNCGPGNINKAISKAKGNKNFWAIYKFLPKETRNYVPAFIALVYTFKYHENFSITPKEYNFPKKITKVKVKHTVHLQQIADWFKVDKVDITLLNPQFFTQIIPSSKNGKFTIKLPHKIARKYSMQEKSIYKFRREFYFKKQQNEAEESKLPPEYFKDVKDKELFYYTVKKGDAISSIADKLNLPVSALKEWNNISKDRIYVNQKLKIYLAPTHEADNTILEVYPIEYNQRKPKKKLEKLVYYKVKKGDVLGIIAREYGVTEAAIKEWNNLDNDVVKIGQKLKILPTEIETSVTHKQAEKTESKSGKILYHKVEEGDVLGIIAREYGVTEAAIKEWNNLDNDVVKIGQKLKIIR